MDSVSTHLGRRRVGRVIDPAMPGTDISSKSVGLRVTIRSSILAWRPVFRRASHASARAATSQTNRPKASARIRTTLTLAGRRRVDDPTYRGSTDEGRRLTEPMISIEEALRKSRVRSSRTIRTATIATLLVAMLLTFPVAAHATDLARAEALMAGARFQDAIDLLVETVATNPAHERARMLLARAYEGANDHEKALAAWRELMLVSGHEQNLHEARKAISRLRREQLDRLETAPAGRARRDADPFLIPMPDVDWAGLEVIEDSRYLPPVLPPPNAFEVPPFAHESAHFTVYSTNERLSRVIAERAETYLDFMVERLFQGRSWAVRFPIFVYTTQDDYIKHGGPKGSGGVTMRHVTGKTQSILLYQIRGSGRGGGIWRYGIESVLPHELTHAILNEFFAGHRPPQWLHEAVAGRFEQTREHYAEAARLARGVMAGEIFRMRDLFEQQGYPEQISLFYEQSATVVLYLFETGPSAMHVFLTELKAGHGHDAACAAALGIPEKDAVEEFERRWVAWMKRRYVEARISVAGPSPETTRIAFRPWFGEMDSVEKISRWRTVAVDSLDGFFGVGDSKRDWWIAGGQLRADPTRRGDSTLLGIPIHESAPLTVTCRVKWLGRPGERNRSFGFAQLDGKGNDTHIAVTARLPDSLAHDLTCIWADDLSVYLDGKCAGRFPASHVSGDAPDIDFPLALVAYGPFVVSDLKVAPIREFSDRPSAAADTGKQGGRGSRRRRRP